MSKLPILISAYSHDSLVLQMCPTKCYKILLHVGILYVEVITHLKLNYSIEINRETTKIIQAPEILDNTLNLNGIIGFIKMKTKLNAYLGLNIHSIYKSL